MAFFAFIIIESKLQGAAYLKRANLKQSERWSFVFKMAELAVFYTQHFKITKQYKYIFNRKVKEEKSTATKYVGCCCQHWIIECGYNSQLDWTIPPLEGQLLYQTSFISFFLSSIASWPVLSRATVKVTKSDKRLKNKERKSGFILFILLCYLPHFFFFLGKDWDLRMLYNWVIYWRKFQSRGVVLMEYYKTVSYKG